MGRITAIEPQVRHTNRFNLYVDDRFVLGLSALMAAKVHVGQILTDADLNNLEQDEAFETAYEKALRFLEPRPRSSTEVKQHLLKKKIELDTADKVITRLTESGLLDDTAFAKYWVENREQFRPRAARALRFELKRKGLSDSDIKDAVGEMDENDSAYRAGANRAKRWRNLERREFVEKLTGFLVRRGFSYSVAKDAVVRLWNESRTEEFDP
ncbi:MAG: RecX family transcriptional regulator [Chloroflexi bacterium]|nr:RecX family transcriptional regulator [Chloroflexota bacterium]